MKRLLLIGLFILLCLLGIALVAPRLRLEGTSRVHALRAVPLDAALVVRVNRPYQLAQAVRRDSVGWAILQRASYWPLLSRLFDSLRLRAEGPLGRGFDEQRDVEAVFSVHPGVQHSANYLLAVYAPAQSLAWARVAPFLLPDSTVVDAPYTYNGVTIHKCMQVAGHATAPLFCAQQQRVLLVASDQILIEQALRLLTDNYTLADNPTFSALYRNANTSELLTLFLQPGTLAPLLGYQLGAPFREATLALGKWARWLVLDLTSHPSWLVASGHSSLADSLSGRSAVLANNKPCAVQVHHVVPDNARLLLRWAEVAPEANLGALPALIDYRPQGYSERAMANDRALLRTVGSGELALAALATPERADKLHWAAFVATKSPSLTIAQLAKTLAHGHDPEVRKIDRELNLPVYKSTQPDWLHNALSPLFPADVCAYFCQVEGFLVFANDPATLERILLANVRNKTLAGARALAALRSDIQSDCNFMLYVDLTSPNSILPTVVAPKLLSSKAPVASPAQAVVLQMSAAKGIAFYNCCLLGGASAQDKAHTIWETRLQAPPLGRPQFVESHLTTGKEILVQDTLHALYLINGQGRILWRKQLPGAILGEPAQVDVYRNGKLQYAFLTPQSLWVVDRNGNNVADFPIALPSPAVAPLGVFDYDHSRHYRFAVAMENRAVVMFDNLGKRVVGFKPMPLDQPACLAPAHVRTAGKDFIVLADPARLYLLDRQGRERLRCQDPIAVCPNAPLYLAGGDPATLMTIDGEGNLCGVNMANGAVTRTALEVSSRDAVPCVVPVGANGAPWLALVKGKKLYLLAPTGRVKASRTFDTEPLASVQCFSFAAGDWRLGLFEPRRQRYWLLDAQLNPCAGFPLPACSLAAIGHLEQSSHQFNLIAAGTASFLLNYAVQQ